MVSQIERQLVREHRLRNRGTFDDAVRMLATDFRTAGNTPGGDDDVPLDTGFLRENFRTSNRSVTSDVLRTTISVEAREGNADYAAILEKARRIEPRKAKYLRFTPSGSSTPVFSKGFDNRWFQWWTKWLAKNGNESGRWSESLRKASARSI